MKSMIKVLFVVCLFVSVSFAEGDMGNGTKTCTGNCLIVTQPEQTEVKEPKSEESILETVRVYLDSVLGIFTNLN